VQAGNLVGGVGLAQALLQKFSEKVMVPKPFTVIVERQDEQIGTLKGVEHGAAILPPGDGVAQRSVQAVENGGLLEKTLELHRLALKHFLHQVVGDVVVIATEGGNEGVAVELVLHGKGHHLQTGNPAFSAQPEGGDVLVFQVKQHDLVEESGDFLGCEA
jgi:hypothetical protein